jgi:hypothetical protein
VEDLLPKTDKISKLPVDKLGSHSKAKNNKASFIGMFFLSFEPQFSFALNLSMEIQKIRNHIIA